MKKTNNKGFSLVELISVIAIMAILAGAIAPALIKYIDKSRKSNDVTSAKAIKTAIETAMSNESFYEYLTTGTGFARIDITPGVSTSADDAGHGGVLVTVTGPTTEKINGKEPAAIKETGEKTIASNIGEKTPKLKYRKNASDKDSTDVPTKFTAIVSKGGTVYMFIASDAATFSTEDDGTITGSDKKAWEIQPNICDEYQ